VSSAPRLPVPPPLRRLGPAALAHLLILAATYLLALAFFPFVKSQAEARAYFAETYFGCLGASALVSLVALWLKPGMRLGFALGLRCYLLVVMGYSMGSLLSAKLVLGIGFMEELGALLPWPAGAFAAAAAILALGGAEAWPFFFGASAIAERRAPAAPDQLAAFCLVLALAAAAALRLARAAARQKELGEIIVIQERNLDTLADLNQSLQGYARTVDEESTERERNRISREIHDISGYILTNIIALMDAAGSMPRENQAGLADLLVTARSQAQEGLRETRLALRKLRSESLGIADSAGAIHKIVAIFRKTAGIEVELNLGNLPRALPHEFNLALYRTVQEALTNAIRHGKASKVRISFWAEGGRLRLTIADNGKGALEVVKGIGLAGMEERVGALGGELEIGRAAEGGFALDIRLPLGAAGSPGGTGLPSGRP